MKNTNVFQTELNAIIELFMGRKRARTKFFTDIVAVAYFDRQIDKKPFEAINETLNEFVRESLDMNFRLDANCFKGIAHKEDYETSGRSIANKFNRMAVGRSEPVSRAVALSSLAAVAAIIAVLTYADKDERDAVVLEPIEEPAAAKRRILAHCRDVFGAPVCEEPDREGFALIIFTTLLNAYFTLNANEIETVPKGTLSDALLRYLSRGADGNGFHATSGSVLNDLGDVYLMDTAPGLDSAALKIGGLRPDELADHERNVSRLLSYLLDEESEELREKAARGELFDSLRQQLDRPVKKPCLLCVRNGSRLDTYLLLSALFVRCLTDGDSRFLPVFIDADALIYNRELCAVRDAQQRREALDGFLKKIPSLSGRSGRTHLFFICFSNPAFSRDGANVTKNMIGEIRKKFPTARFVAGVPRSARRTDDARADDAPFSEYNTARRIRLSAVDLSERARIREYLDLYEMMTDRQTEPLPELLHRFDLKQVDTGLVDLLFEQLRSCRDADSLFDLYEKACLDLLETDADSLDSPSVVAYNMLYVQGTRHNDVSKANYLVDVHDSIADFLVANYYSIELFRDPEDMDLEYFEKVFPKTVTRFIVPKINSNERYMGNILALYNNYYEQLDVYAKDELVFFLGRIRKNKHLADKANAILRKLYIKLKTDLFGAGPLSAVSPEDRRASLLLFRGVTISLIYMGSERIAQEYICLMLEDKTVNMINRGFHLEYYGDIPAADKQWLALEDDPRSGSKTMNNLCYNIEDRFICRNNTPVLEIELFTLCSLLQARIRTGAGSTDFDLTPYVEKCLSFLARYKNNWFRSVSNDKLTAYFAMVERDLTRFLEKIHASPVLTDLYDHYVGTAQIPRTGWVDLDFPEPESVTEHMYGAWLLAMMHLPDKKEGDPVYDKERILQMLLIHDLGEAVTGDIRKYDKVGRVDLENQEDDAMRTLLLHDSYTDDVSYAKYYDAWVEWREHKTVNAKVAKDVDTLQAVYQFCRYYARYAARIGEETLRHWLDESRWLETPIVYGLFESLVLNNSAFSPFIPEEYKTNRFSGE